MVLEKLDIQKKKGGEPQKTSNYLKMDHKSNVKLKPFRKKTPKFSGSEVANNY